nr:hypothetical protein [Tanacetum cinerariifolium]
MDAATVLASRAVEVPTGSGSIPTAGPPAAEVPTGSDVVLTASPVFSTTTVVTLYRRRNDKEVMVESDTPKKQKVQEQIDAQGARELEEQLEREDQRSQGEACLTNSGYIADQDRATIAKSSTLPYDSAPWVTSLVVVEGTQEIEITRLKARVKLLEDREGGAAERSRDDLPIKGRNLDEGEAAADRAKVPTGSGSIPTAGPPAAEVPTGSDVVLTASPVFSTTTVVTLYRRRNDKEVMVESDTPKKQKVQEQIDAQGARELEEQLEREDQRRSE